MKKDSFERFYMQTPVDISQCVELACDGKVKPFQCQFCANSNSYDISNEKFCRFGYRRGSERSLCQAAFRLKEEFRYKKEAKKND